MKKLVIPEGSAIATAKKNLNKKVKMSLTRSDPNIRLNFKKQVIYSNFTKVNLKN